MITIKPKGAGCECKCDACSLSQALEATTVDNANDELRNLGWTSFPRKGQGVAKWSWKCPACFTAQYPHSMGPSAGWSVK